METKFVGFFAFPGAHLDELIHLDELASRSLDAHQDDFLVRGNDLYRRAAQVCLHHVELSGESARSTFPQVAVFISRGLPLAKNQDVFSPDEVHDMARRVPAWEHRLGGEDRVIARIYKRVRGLRPEEMIRDVYLAFKQVLAVADEHSAGFLWATRNDTAEARLAEKRAQQERERLAAERNPVPDDFEFSDEEDPVLRAEWDAWLAEHNARIEEPKPHLSDPRAETGSCTRFVLVPSRVTGEIQKLLREAARCFDAEDDEGYDTWAEQARELALARAFQIHQLHKTGEHAAAHMMLGAVLAHYPRGCPDERYFTIKQTRELLRAMEQWEAGRGMGPILDDIRVSWLSGSALKKGRSLTANAYHTFKRALTEAVAHHCAFMIIRF